MSNTLLKSTLRQPIHAILLFLLIGSISFVFISRTIEYLVVQRETERLGGYFRSIGYILSLDPEDYEVDVSKGMALIEKSQYVEFENRLQYGSGVLKGIYNADVDGWSGDTPSSFTQFTNNRGADNNDVFFYGVLTRKSRKPELSVNQRTPQLGSSLYFQIDSTVAGYPEYIQDDMEVRVIVSSDMDVYDSLIVGQRYFIRARYEPFTTDKSWLFASQNLQFKPLTDEGSKILQVPAGEFLDFSSPELESLKKEIEIVQENQHAMLVEATVDMSALPLMQESSRFYYLTEGRWINREDNRTANQVCVVRAEFAEMRGLFVGDTISLTLRSLKGGYDGYPYYGYIINGPDREEWQNYPTTSLTCEIVGLYSGLNRTISVGYTFVYIPKSIYNPPSPALDDTSTSYSFVLKSSRDEETFLQENQQAMTDLGLQIRFVDQDGAKFWQAVDPLRLSALTSIVIFGTALVIALFLAVFLYLRQRRRDFAILRALGVPSRAAVRQLMIPMSLIGSLGIIVGGGVSWRYSLNAAAKTLSALPTPAGAMPSTTLNLMWLVGLSIGIIAPLLFFTWIGAVIIARRPVLTLLQGNDVGNQKRKKEQKGMASVVSKQTGISNDGITSNLPAATIPTHHEISQRKGNFSGLLRYQWRHLLRSGLKSFLTVLVALSFVLALGWLQWTIDRNTLEVARLYNSIVVDVQIVQKNASIVMDDTSGFIKRSIVDSILESGFVQNAYLAATSERTNVGKLNETDGEIIPIEQISRLTLLAFDRPDIFFSPSQDLILTNRTIEKIDYAPGWDESLFTVTWTREQLEQDGVPVIFPIQLLDRLDLDYGDSVYVSSLGGKMRLRVAGQYIGGSSFSDVTILMPLSALAIMDGNSLRYSVAKFELDPSRNSVMPAFRQTIEDIVGDPISGQATLRVVIWDEELRAVVAPLEKNLSLMAILYPVTIGLSLLIAIGLNFLLIIQSAKEAAILRVLGTTRPKVRAMFSTEQAALTLIGLIIGLMGLAILRKDAAVAFSYRSLLNAGLYFAGALLGALSGAISVTRRKPLELLQVKE